MDEVFVRRDLIDVHGGCARFAPLPIGGGSADRIAPGRRHHCRGGSMAHVGYLVGPCPHSWPSACCSIFSMQGNTS